MIRFTFNKPDDMQPAVTQGLKNGVQQATSYLATYEKSVIPQYPNIQHSIIPDLTALADYKGTVIQQVSVAKYGPWVNNGTGIYGPYNTPIVPVNGNVLAWPKSKPTHVYRSVKGQKAQHFWEKAKTQTSKVAEIIQTAIQKALGA